MMRQASRQLDITSRGQGLMDVTRPIAEWVSRQEIGEGLLTILCRHTSASLLIQENAAPAARADLERYFAQIAPESGDYAHDEEGADDMPAHLRAALTGVTLSIPVVGGRMALGTWQGIFLFEHRRRPHVRSLAMHLIGR